MQLISACFCHFHLLRCYTTSSAASNRKRVVTMDQTRHESHSRHRRQTAQEPQEEQPAQASSSTGQPRQPAHTASGEIELRGHIIDSYILPRVWGAIEDAGAHFRVLDMRVGQSETEPS